MTTCAPGLPVFRHAAPAPRRRHAAPVTAWNPPAAAGRL